MSPKSATSLHSPSSVDVDAEAAVGGTQQEPSTSLFPDPESQILSESSQVALDLFVDNSIFLTHLDEVLGPLASQRHKRVQEKSLTQWPYA